MLVLLAEHQKHARRLLAHLLNQHDLDVIEAEDVTSCRAALVRQPRLALVDWQLPPEDGPGLFASLRLGRPAGSLYVVAIVPGTSAATHADALAAGADDVLVLPAALDIVRERLNMFITAARRPELGLEPDVEPPAQGAADDVLSLVDGPAFALDEHGVIRVVNLEFEELTGLPADALQGLPGTVLGLTDDAVNAGRAQLQRPDGIPIDILLRELPIVIKGHRLDMFVCERAVVEQPSLVAPVVEQAAARSRELYLMFERGGAVRSISDALAAALGYAVGELVGGDVRTLLHPDDVPKLRETLPRRGQQTVGAELRLRQRDGQWLAVLFEGRSAADVGGVDGFVLVGRDGRGPSVTPRDVPDWTELDDRLVDLSHRTAFVEQLGEALAEAAAGAEPLGVLVIDVASSDAPHGLQGERRGDQLIVEIAERLRRHVRSEDVLARIADDEFALLARGLRDDAGAIKIAERILADFRRRPFLVDGRDVQVTPGIGIALGTPGGERPSELLRKAEEALARSLSAGPGNHAVHREESERRATAHLTLDSELLRAVERDEFRVYYQPEVDLRDGSIVGVEALVRWQHPQRGLLLPSEFITSAEESGVIQRIGAWVLERAAKDVAEWQRQFDLDERFTVGVNFSAAQFRQADVVEQVARVLRRSGLAPRSLRIEISERLLAGNDAELILVLDHLKELGLQLAIDNFGGDYSSLGYLRWLPASVIKVDKNYVSGAGTGSGRLSVAQSAAAIARSVGMELVVEGIETSDQLDRVLALELVRGQGFYFSRAVSRDTLGFLLSAGPQPFSALLHSAGRE